MKKENLTATIVRTLIENARAQRKNIIENIDDDVVSWGTNWSTKPGDIHPETGHDLISKGPKHLLLGDPEGGLSGHYNGIPFSFPEYHENTLYGEEPPTRRELMDEIPRHPHKREIADLVIKHQENGDLD